MWILLFLCHCGFVALLFVFFFLFLGTINVCKVSFFIAYNAYFPSCRSLSMRVLSATVSTLCRSTLCLYHVCETQIASTCLQVTSSVSAMHSTFGMVRLLPALIKDFWADFKCMPNIKRLITSVSSMACSYSYLTIWQSRFKNECADSSGLCWHCSSLATRKFDHGLTYCLKYVM